MSVLSLKEFFRCLKYASQPLETVYVFFNI